MKDALDFLQKILLSQNVCDEIKLNMETLVKIIPEIKFIVGFPHKHPHHHLDVWEHTLLALSLSKNNFDVRFCLLLHDIGKPFSFQDGADGVRHFKNHQVVSSLMAKEILLRLGFDNNYIEKMCYLIKYHDTMITNEDIKQNWLLQKIRLEVQRCDGLAHNPKYLDKKNLYIEQTSHLLEQYYSNKENLKDKELIR